MSADAVLEEMRVDEIAISDEERVKHYISARSAWTIPPMKFKVGLENMIFKSVIFRFSFSLFIAQSACSSFIHFFEIYMILCDNVCHKKGHIYHITFNEPILEAPAPVMYVTPSFSCSHFLCTVFDIHHHVGL